MIISQTKTKKTMDKDILKQVGITEQEFKNMQDEWMDKRKHFSEKYIQSPEYRLMDAIYGGK